MEQKQKNYRIVFIMAALVVPAVVMLLVYLPKNHEGEIAGWIYTLPLINTLINATTAVLLIAGVFFVKSGRVSLHKKTMISAFILGICFLTFYILYHANVPSTKFGGDGSIRNVYFFFLITHILMAFALAPLVLFTVYYAAFQKLEKHKKIVKFTFPVWLYVSVTGVIVYLMISPYYTH